MTTTATQMLRPYVRRQWRALSGAGGMAVVLALADLAKPWPLKLVIDHIILGRTGPFALGRDELTVLAVVTALVLAIALSSAIGENLASVWLQRAGERISHELRSAVYDHLQRLSLRFHQQRQAGDLVTRVTGDANAVGDMFAGSLGNVVQASVLLVGMLVVTLVLDPLLALAWLAVVPFLAVVAFRFRGRIRATARRQRAQEGEMASLASEALSAMAVVKVHGSEGFEGDRVRQRSERRMHIGIEASRLQARFNALIGGLSALGTAAVIALGVVRVSAGAISVGDLVVFVSYAKKADSPLRHLAREAAKIARSMARAERIAEILAADDVLEERPGAFAGGRATGEIVFDDVSFAYEPGRPVLSGVSLRIPAGERLAVMGPSGAGKSTLGALVARLYDPGGGRLLLDGRDARDCSLAWLRGQVGLLLQDTVLFTGSVEENIAYGAEVSPQAIVAAARAAAADEFVATLPEGHRTELGPRGAGLSGGQRQRIGIARMLLRDPPILLLDEPTSALDAAAEARLLDGIERLMRGRTTILVTHSVELARRCDRVVVVEAGRIVAQGSPEEVLAHGGGGGRPVAAAPSGPTPTAPPDPALPQLNRLLTADAMLPVLARSLGPEREVEQLRVARVLYKPGKRIAVHFRALVDGREHDAVARAVADRQLADEAARHLDAARAVDGRSPARVPLAYDAELDALVSWLPFDARLPALTEPPTSLLRRLRDSGVEVPGDAREPHLLGYKPGARVVLRLGDHVLKAYGREHQYRRALAGLVASAELHSVATAGYEGRVPPLRLTVQAAVDGVVPETAVDAAAEAGALARRLQEARVDGLPAYGPDALLAEVERRAALLRAIAPRLGPRLDALVEGLRARLPAPMPLAPAHGDFHVDQLLRIDGELHLIDFDGMCVAPAALDLATYLADVVRGRGGDLDRIAAVARPLLDGYGAAPPALDWFLAAVVLCRAPHPFHRFVSDWPARVVGMVATAEAALEP